MTKKTNKQINVRRVRSRIKTMRGKLDIKKKERDKVFNSRTKKWQESELGEDYQDRTSLLDYTIEDLDEVMKTLTKYLDE